MTQQHDYLLKKINLVVDKLMNLEPPELTEDLSAAEQIKKGLVTRDFGINVWDWPQGVGLYGLIKLNQYYGDARYDRFFAEWYHKNMIAGLPPKNVNTTAPFLVLAELYQHFDDANYETMCIEHANWLIESLPKTREGGFQHVTSAIDNAHGVILNEGELWIDTIFMTVLFLNKMGHKFNNQQWIDEGIHQVLLHIKYLYSKQTGLFYHGWTFKENSNFGGIYWCRGNSWFTFGIIDYIEEFKGTMNQGLKTYLLDTYRAQVAALRQLQAASGLWHTVLTDPSSYEEVSGSAAILTGILKGLKMGVLDDSYRDCARKALDAICHNISDDGTVLNVSSGTAMGNDADHYKQIAIAPMAYGQSLALTALCEALD